MLEFFRRHRGPFMIGITIVVIISFAWWTAPGSKADGQLDPDSTMLEVYGRSYSFNDVARYQSLQRLCYQLGLYELAFGLPGVVPQEVQDREKGADTGFTSNLLVLRKQALEHGVAFSDAEAMAKIRTLQPFLEQGKLDESRLANFQNNLGSMGFTIRDVLDIVKDSMAYEKLNDLVAANYAPSAVAVDKSYAAQHQTVKVSTIKFALDDFKKKAEVKDDEIKKYYDEKKDTYKTAEKRAAAYVFFEKPANDDKKTAEQNTQATKDWEKLVNDFDANFHTAGADINKLVEALKRPDIKVKSVPLMEKDKPADAVKEEAAFVTELFRPSLKLGQHSEGVQGAKGYFFLKVTQLEAPRQQELKEVTDKIKETLVAQKAQETMTKAANDARTALQEALKAGKKLADVAKEKAWKVEAVEEMSPTNPPPSLDQGKEIAEAAGKTAVNDVALPISNDKGSVLVVVTGKELRKNESSTALKQGQETSLVAQAKQALFKAWFAQLVKDAKVSRPDILNRS